MMRKNILRLNIILAGALLAAHNSQGMMEEEPPIQIIEKAPEESKIKSITPKNFVIFCLENALRKLARDDVKTQKLNMFSSNGVNDAMRTRTVTAFLNATGISPANFAKAFRESLFSTDSLKTYKEIYDTEYNRLFLSLYPLNFLQKPQATLPVKKLELPMQNMQYIMIQGTTTDQKTNILLYNDDSLSSITEKLKKGDQHTEGITTPKDFRRVFLSNIEFNKNINVYVNGNEIRVSQKGSGNSVTIKTNDNDNKAIKTLALLQDKNGKTVLHLLCQDDTMDNNVKQKLITEFLKNGADPNIPDQDGNTPLHLLCTEPIKNKDLITLLIKRISLNIIPSNPNIQNNEGITPLHFLCFSIITIPVENHEQHQAIMETITLLFKYFADPNLQDQRNISQPGQAPILSNMTPLRMVCASESPENVYIMDTFNLLIANNANPNIKDYQGETALHIICKYQTIPHNVKLKMLEIIFSRYDASVININSKNDAGQTPFFLACYTNNIDLAVFLLKHGANPMIYTKDTGTTLTLTLKNKNYQLIDIIFQTLEKTPQEERKNFINAQDENGKFAIHYAIQLFGQIIQSIKNFIQLHINGQKQALKWLQALTNVNATAENKELISNTQKPFMTALQDDINLWSLPQDTELLKTTISALTEKFKRAQNIWTMMSQYGADITILDQSGQTPQTIYDKYAPVIEKTLYLFAQKLGMKLIDLEEKIKPEVPAIEQESIRVEEKPTTLWQRLWPQHKRKIIGGTILGVGAASFLLYKLYQQYGAKLWKR